MSAESLRPEAEGALGGASAGAIQGDERVKQERYVVATDVEIARVDFSDVRQRIEVADGLGIRIVGDDAVLSIADAWDFFERLTVGEVHYGVVEFLAHDEIDGRTVVEALLGQSSYVRPDKGDLQLGIGGLHGRSQLHVTGEAGGAGEQH